MLQQNALNLVDALKASEQEYALKAERDGDDRLGHVGFVAVLMESKLGAGLVAIDVASVGAELRKSGSNGAAEGEVEQYAGDGRPQALHCGILRIPTAAKSFGSPAVRHHYAHRQSAGRGRMMKRRGVKNAFDCREKLGILFEREAAHQYRGWVDLLMGRFCRKLRKEIHRPKIILSQKGEQKAKLFDNPHPREMESFDGVYPMGYNSE
jgi:hypothetical protein